MSLRSPFSPLRSVIMNSYRKAVLADSVREKLVATTPTRVRDTFFRTRSISTQERMAKLHDVGTSQTYWLAMRIHLKQLPVNSSTHTCYKHVIPSIVCYPFRTHVFGTLSTRSGTNLCDAGNYEWVWQVTSSQSVGPMAALKESVVRRVTRESEAEVSAKLTGEYVS